MAAERPATGRMVRSSLSDVPPPSAEASASDFVADLADIGDLPPVAPLVVDLVDPGTINTGPKAADWNGTKTRVKLGHGMIRDGVFFGEGDDVDFAVAWQAGVRRDEETGEMVAGWAGPEAATFLRLYTSGYFLGTTAYAQRNAAQLNINAERGIDRANLPNDPRPRGLEALNSDEQRQRVEDMLRGGPAEMKRKEAQEARSASDEASDRMTAALEKVIERIGSR